MCDQYQSGGRVVRGVENTQAGGYSINTPWSVPQGVAGCTKETYEDMMVSWNREDSYSMKPTFMQEKRRSSAESVIGGLPPR
jgi:hypothetical protein